MKKHNCEKCPSRAKFDKNPKSFSGRLWRWHINWCPGWKSYLKSLNKEQQIAIKTTYKIGK